MNCKEILYSAITFSLCSSLINKILAIVFSFIKLGLYLKIFLFLKNGKKETKKFESLIIFQFTFEIFMIFTSAFMIIFSKYLNRKHLYRLFRAFTIIISIYLFFGCFIGICNFAYIKFITFPDLFSLDEDPIFKYSDDNSRYSLEYFISKKTNTINISLINNDIFDYTFLEKNNDTINVNDSLHFIINFNNTKSKNYLTPFQKRHEFEFNLPMKLQLTIIFFDILSFFYGIILDLSIKN